MGYKSSFLDNELYGAEDISRIFTHLVAEGTVIYPENLTVAESINEMTSTVLDAGVSEYGGLAVTKTETGVRIGEGAGFFKSGVCVEVDADGVLLDILENTALYIYFVYENDFNRVRVSADSILPEGDVLLLAEVSPDGSIADRRSYAKCKIIPNSGNYYHDFTVTHQRYGSYGEESVLNTTHYTMPHGDFHYLLLHKVEGGSIASDIQSNIIDLTAEGEQSIALSESTITPYVNVLKTENDLKIRSTRYGYANEVHKFYFTLV